MLTFSATAYTVWHVLAPGSVGMMLPSTILKCFTPYTPQTLVHHTAQLAGQHRTRAYGVELAWA